MTGFAGFPAGKQAYTPVPHLFFSELLPDIDHLGELKVTLHVFWLLTQKTGEHRYVSSEELAADRRLLAGVAQPGLPAEDVLRDALERAVARRTLLQVTTGDGAKRRDWYFVNSERGRPAVDDLLAGAQALGATALVHYSCQLSFLDRNCWNSSLRRFDVVLGCDPGAHAQ